MTALLLMNKIANSQLAIYLLVSAAGYLAPVCEAQIFEWTGLGTGSWSDGASWSPGVPISDPTTALVFDNLTAGTTTHNLGANFILNSLTLGEGNGGRTFNASGGSTLVFAGTTPFIENADTAGVGNHSFGMPVRLDANLTLRGIVSFDRQFIFSSAAPISGSGGLRVESGVFTTNAINSYLGETVVTGGILGSNANGGFGGTSGVRVEGTGSIQIFGNSTIDKPLSIGGFGSVALGNYSLASSGAGTRNWSGPITVTADTRIRAFSGSTLSLTNTLDLGGNELQLFSSTDSSILSSGVISGNGDLTIGLSPSTQFGTVLLQGVSANTFAGSILVQNSRLGFDKDSQFGDAANTITLNGGTLATNNIGGSSVTRVLPSSRDLTIGAAGGRFEGRNFQILDIQTEIKGTGPVGVAGRVIFAAGNTFNGTLTLEAGSNLRISDDSALGSLSNVVRLEGDAFGATLQLQSDGTILQAGRTIEVPDGFVGTIQSGNSGSHTINATLTGQTLKLSGGDFTLTAANSVQRLDLTGFQNTLTVSSDAALGASNGTVALLQGTLRAAGGFTFGATRTLEISAIDGTTSTIDTQNHTLVFDGNIVKGGFSSPTMRKIGEGTLIFNGNASTISQFEVEEGTLGGSGTFGELVIHNATLSPGQSAGLITLDRLELGSSSNTLMEIGGTGRGTFYDAIDGNNFSVSGGATLSIELINGFSPSAGAEFLLFDFNDYQGNFGDISLPALPNSLEWDASNLMVNGSLYVIPEPATSGLVLLSAVVFAARRRVGKTKMR